MTIGIVTLYDVGNYGAALQAYGLYSFLENHGYTPVLIHVPIGKTNPFLKSVKRHTLNRRFTGFITREMARQTSDLKRSFDIYIVGSDQVWNPEIVGDKLPTFMLSFAPDNKKKLSYASSLGLSKWPPHTNLPLITKLLRRFDAISVREKTGSDLLRHSIGVESTVVADPSLLIQDYSKLINSKIIQHGKSKLIAFKLHQDAGWALFLNELGDILNVPTESLISKYVPFLGTLKGFNIKSPAVTNWFTKMACARYVVTDSFHGMMVCLITQRQFAIVPGIKSRLNRITDFLTLIGLDDRIAESPAGIAEVLSNPIDYSIVTPRLNTIIDKSKKWLLSELEK